MEAQRRQQNLIFIQADQVPAEGIGDQTFILSADRLQLMDWNHI